MTEKRGGSDVSGATETIAVHETGSWYRLHGVKWFSSAIDANVAFTLARVEGKISLFLVTLRDGDGTLNNIQIIRLKDKLGTK
jgi:alkylation response protein AidB-like acyl-CoA dehydrogenase